MALKHTNSGRCGRCQEIIDKYPGFDKDLRAWFETFQAGHPEAHVSEAGRGREMQEILFNRGASKARYGYSSHNYNCALDLFEMGGAKIKDIYETSWFKTVLAPALPPWIRWYGEPGSKFWELPHVEIRDWEDLATKGLIALVEE